MSERYSFAFSAETGYEWLMDHGNKWVALTEPEDRTWYRDLAPVLVRLNNHDLRITGLEAENARLREALTALYDHQNGPPLPSYEQGWRDAMDLARWALQEGSDD